jgi:hypothetical protein
MSDTAEQIVNRLDAMIAGMADVTAELRRLRMDLDSLSRDVADLRLSQSQLIAGEQEIRRHSTAIDKFLEVQSQLMAALSARHLDDLLTKAQREV